MTAGTYQAAVLQAPQMDSKYTYASVTRLAVLAFGISLACGGGKHASDPTAIAESGSGSESDPGPEKPELDLERVTFLQSDPIVQQRVSDQSELATSLKHVPTLVETYDHDHPGALPDSLDVVIVVRPGASKSWLVGAKGDVSAPALETSLAAIPRFGVKTGNVAVVMSFVRVGGEQKQTQSDKGSGDEVDEQAAQKPPEPAREPYLPSSWKTAAGSGTSIDDAIDAAWPP